MNLKNYTIKFDWGWLYVVVVLFCGIIWLGKIIKIERQLENCQDNCFYFTTNLIDQLNHKASKDEYEERLLIQAVKHTLSLEPEKGHRGMNGLAWYEDLVELKDSLSNQKRN